MKKSKLLLFIAVVGCFLFASVSPAFSADTIKVGIIGPMQFVQGKGHWNGALMAADEINGKGGVQVGNKKMKIELIKADSNEFLNVTDATNAMELLCTRDKVDFIIGGFRSEAVLAMQDIAMDYEKLFLGAGAAHDKLCLRVVEDYDRYKYFFRATPFKSSYLGRTCFMQMGYVGAVMKAMLGLEKVKVAVVAEKAIWVEPLIKAAEGVIPKMGMELAGVWRPSAIATDVTAELSAIQRSGAQMIFTIFSSSVGIPFARQAGELKIPAVQVGINVESQKDGFWEATQGHGNYVIGLNTYCQSAAYNDLTKPFVDGYVKRFGETPPYTAAVYSAIKDTLVGSIEATGSIDAEKLIPYIEKTEFVTAGGTSAMELDKEGRQTHDLKWGPGYLTSMATQWIDGKMVAVWPAKGSFKDAPEFTYEGVVPVTLPPWVIEAHKK